jgi:ABC-2 type transport system permease protein
MRDWFVVLFPFITGLIFIIIINISGGYLLQSVVDEKDNRTMEVLITSVSPEALMAGKILGNLAVGLTQLAIWLGFGLGGMAIFQLLSGYPLLPVIGGEHFLLIMGLILPGFIMVAALMTLVGVTATEMREAQQVSVLFTMPMVSPFWFAGAILQHPGNPLTTFLSIFPLTAIVTMPLRSSISAVPAWQMALAILLMWASALGALWLASRGFRQGMLVYGKRIRLKEFMQLIRKGENHV